MIILHTTERDFPWATLRSRFSCKVKVILEEKGLAYRTDNLPAEMLGTKPPELLDQHPLGKVPFIEDGEMRLFDSTVINEYLEERYPEPALMPRGVCERARVRELEQFGDESVLEDLLDVVVPYWTIQPPKRDAQAQDKARQKLARRSLPFMEKVLAPQTGEGIHGAFSLADAPYMVLAMVLEVDGMDLSAFPSVDAYLRRLRERPSYRAISPRTKVAEASSRD
jgi:glutathione S-transferase